MGVTRVDDVEHLAAAQRLVVEAFLLNDALLRGRWAGADVEEARAAVARSLERSGVRFAAPELQAYALAIVYDADFSFSTTSARDADGPAPRAR